MSAAPDTRYRVLLRNGDRLDAVDVEWLHRRVRVTLPVWRHDEHPDTGTVTRVRDGERVREYPAGNVRFVEDLEPEAPA